MDQDILQHLRIRDLDQNVNSSSEDRVPSPDSPFAGAGAGSLPSQPVPTSFSPFSSPFIASSHPPQPYPSPDKDTTQTRGSEPNSILNSEALNSLYPEGDVDSDLRDMTISPDVMELDSEEEREREGERQGNIVEEKTAQETIEW